MIDFQAQLVLNARRWEIARLEGFITDNDGWVDDEKADAWADRHLAIQSAVPVTRSSQK